jgi:hypothetical protein
MGIHFACHHCNHALHVKDFQAGKRGRCPDCKQSFRIPMSDAAYSISIEEGVLQPIGAKQADLKKATLEALNGEGVFSEATKSKRTKTDAVAPTTNKDYSASVLTESSVKARSILDSDIDIPVAEEPTHEPLWFVRPPSGGQFGPAPAHLLHEWIQERRVTDDSYLWCEGMQDWKLAADLFHDRFAKLDSAGIAVSSNAEQIVEAEEPSLIDDELHSNSDTGPELTISPAGIAIKKKVKKRQQQWMFVVILGVVSLLLFIALVYVLFFQATKSTLGQG